MNTLTFEKNRKKAKYCPCNKSNKDGKFAPYVGYFDKGFCHSCGNTFLPDTENSTIVKPFIPEPPKPFSFHDFKLVTKSQKNFENNNFILFLKSLFTADEVMTAINKYRIGTSKYYKGATIFWQIDQNQKVRHGKVFLYDEKTGKKSKINSVRSILKLDDFNLKQCLFGLHLIKEAKQKTIALVESEKTAILMSLFKPEYIWLATGGLSEFKHDKLKPVKAFSIVAFPDKGKLTNWNDKAKELEKYGYNITVNSWLEKQDFPNETDFADVLILAKKQPQKPSHEPTQKDEVLKTERIERHKREPENTSAFSTVKKEQPENEILSNNKNENWSNEISELEIYYSENQMTKKSIKLNQCTKIIDVPKFIESHFAIVKANIGNKRYLPYFNRLQELKNLIKTNV